MNDAVTDIVAEGDLSAAFGARCAVGELPVAGEALVEATTSLSVSVSASAELIGGFAG